MNERTEREAYEAWVRAQARKPPCNDCNGEGWKFYEPLQDGAQGHTATCPTCRGTGKRV